MTIIRDAFRHGRCNRHLIQKRVLIDDYCHRIQKNHNICKNINDHGMRLESGLLLRSKRILIIHGNQVESLFMVVN